MNKDLDYAFLVVSTTHKRFKIDHNTTVTLFIKKEEVGKLLFEDKGLVGEFLTDDKNYLFWLVVNHKNLLNLCKEEWYQGNIDLYDTFHNTLTNLIKIETQFH